jgi:hypothetical protein
MTLVSNNPNPNRTPERANLYVVDRAYEGGKAFPDEVFSYPHDETYESNGMLNNTDL